MLIVRGWLEYPEGRVDEVRALLDGFVGRADELGLTPDAVLAANRGWILPALQLADLGRPPSWTHMFLGADVDAELEGLFRAQVEALAALFSWDGPLRRWTEGIVHLEDDDGRWAKVWRVDDGAVREEAAG